MSWAALAQSRRYWLDEVSIIGFVVAAYTATLLYTWGAVSQDLYLRGLFFLGITGVGLAFFFASGTIGSSLLVRSWRELLKTGLAVAVGWGLTRILQYAIIQASGGLTVLATIPTELQRIYLAQAALCETIFVFGIFTFLAARLHWLVGMVWIAVSTPFLHSYVYGSLPNALLAVVASFLLQGVLYFVTRRPSVPLLIHLGGNLL